MSSQIATLRLSVVGKGMRRLKENGLVSKEDIKMYVRKKMWFLRRSLMQLRNDMVPNLESSRIKVMIGYCYNVGFVAKSIARMIVHCTKVACHKCRVLERCRHLGMLVKEFLKTVQHLITCKRIIRHPLLRWKVSSVIKLFPF